MSLTILLEIGHDASVRSKLSPEGFTHDWEVFVKGQNNADIHYYVEKVVFNLHETFPKPKRVVKEPPFSLRTSGYAGFKLPIEIYLRNNQEPKRIKFNYDLDLQPQGPPIHVVTKEKYTFFNPSEEFRIKLLKGGAVEGSGNQENSINRVASEEKNQMTSKPKLSGSEITKKHKMKFDEPRNTDFENLFGPPIKKNSKLPEQPKPREPAPPPKPVNSEKTSEKEKNDKSKSNKSVHKDKEKEKPKEKSSDSSDKRSKDEKKKSKDEKSKDKERSKDKSSKKEKEREKSPPPRPQSPSPKRSPRRDSSPPVQKHNSSKEKESVKEEKKEKDRDKDKKEDKKSKKDRRDHKEGKHKDREKDKEHREHKSKDKESKSSRDKESSSSVKLKESSPLPPVPVSSQTTNKTDKKPKEKDHSKESKEEEKVERLEKPEKVEKVRSESDDRQNKHKHKKKDRKEKKEEKHSKKDEKKNEKQPSSTSNSKDVSKESISVPSNREIDKSSNLFGSPKSDAPSTPKEPEPKTENNTLFVREDESSNDTGKMSSREASPAPRIPSKSPSPLPPPEPVKKTEPEKKKEPSPKKKDKKEKKKDKKVDKDHEKRRKRKSDSTTVAEVEPPEKVIKVEENISDEESKVSSTEDATVIIQPKSEFDMDMLRELQHKIMSLKDSADLQKVVQLIAETGQYEVSAHTFDFDLCLLDRSTVRQLQDFFATIS